MKKGGFAIAEPPFVVRLMHVRLSLCWWGCGWLVVSAIASPILCNQANCRRIESERNKSQTVAEFQIQDIVCQYIPL